MLFIVPAITTGLAITNESHGLIWSKIVPVMQSGTQHLIYYHGIFFWIHLIYSYILIIAATFYLVRSFFSFPKSQRGKVIVILIGALIPWIGNFVYISGLFPIKGLDVTPFSFAFTGLIMAFAVFRHNLFDIVPIARDLLVENMQEGFIVIDGEGKVVDINPMARVLINAGESKVVGKQAAEVLLPYPEIAEKLLGNSNEQAEIRIDKLKYVEVRVSPLLNKRDQQTGRLIALRDVTERKRLETIEHDQRIFAEALRDSAEALNSSLDFNEVLERILENAGRVVPHQTADIALVGEEGQISFVRTHGYKKRDEEEVVKNIHFYVKDTPNFLKMKVSGKPVIIQDTYADPEWRREPGTEWIRSYLGAPIKTKDKLLGFIDLDSDKVDSFTKEQAERLQAFANQAAIAVENARLFSEKSQYAEQMETFYKIGLVITSGLNMDQVIKKISEQCKRFVKIDLFYLALYDEKSQMINFPLFELKGKPYSVEARNIKEKPGITGYVIKNKRTIYIPDLLNPSSEFPANQIVTVPGDEGRTYLGVPLILGKKVIGVLSIQSNNVDAYTQEQIHLLETFTTQATIAIDNARLFARVKEMAITDFLTGLYNCRHIFNIAEKEIARSLRYKKEFSMIMIDIDKFKLDIRKHGHSIGDRVLKALALNCNKVLRTVDSFGRIGGEEFLVLLPETNVQRAQNVAERLRKEVELMRIDGEEGNISITISLGVTTLKDTQKDLGSLLIAVDKALYKAKRMGRNCVAVL